MSIITIKAIAKEGREAKYVNLRCPNSCNLYKNRPSMAARPANVAWPIQAVLI